MNRVWFAVNTVLVGLVLWYGGHAIANATVSCPEDQWEYYSCPAECGTSLTMFHCCSTPLTGWCCQWHCYNVTCTGTGCPGFIGTNHVYWEGPLRKTCVDPPGDCQ